MELQAALHVDTRSVLSLGLPSPRPAGATVVTAHSGHAQRRLRWPIAPSIHRRSVRCSGRESVCDLRTATGSCWHSHCRRDLHRACLAPFPESAVITARLGQSGIAGSSALAVALPIPVADYRAIIRSGVVAVRVVPGRQSPSVVRSRPAEGRSLRSHHRVGSPRCRR